MCVQKVSPNNPKIKKNLLKTNKGQPRKRMTHVYNLCKRKNICEDRDEIDLAKDEGITNKEEKSSLVGCGRYQPKFRRQALELTAKWTKHVNEDF
jgi:DNA-directed RNA polymerase II subunit RPB1